MFHNGANYIIYHNAHGSLGERHFSIAILPNNATEQFGDGRVEWPFRRSAQSATQSGSFVSMSTMAKVFIDFHMYFFKIPTAPSPIQILARLQNQANQG